MLYIVIYRYISQYFAIYRYISLYIAITRYKSLYIVFFRFIRKNQCKYAHACMTNPTVSSVSCSFIHNIRKNLCKYAHACMTNPTVSCSIYGKTRAKYTTDAQPQQCQYAIIPCFYVCYEKVTFFTVFFRIK